MKSLGVESRLGVAKNGQKSLRNSLVQNGERDKMRERRENGRVIVSTTFYYLRDDIFLNKQIFVGKVPLARRQKLFVAQSSEDNNFIFLNLRDENTRRARRFSTTVHVIVS